MKGTIWLATAALFVASIVVFSNGYRATLGFFEFPTLEKLFTVIAHLAVLILILAALAFIMYATERTAGNVKVKNHLFEKLLGFVPDATLPTKSEAAAVHSSPRKGNQR